MSSDDQTEFQAERAVPGVSPPELVAEHVARYRFAAPLVSGRRVLDLGCGVGYGSRLLAAAGAERVLALDLSPEAVLATRHERRNGAMSSIVGDGQRLPFSDTSVDCVVAFEVIEHMEDCERFLGEIRRVLRDDGLFIMSTPNRLTYNENRSAGLNPYHTQEFDRRELRRLLGNRFDETLLYRQVYLEGVFIAPPRRSVRTADHSAVAWEVLDAAPDPETDYEPDYFVAICHNRSASWLRRAARGQVFRNRRSFTPPTGAFFVSPTDFLRRLRSELRRRQEDLDEKRTWALDLDRQLREREQELLTLQEDLESKVSWARSLEAETQARRARVVELQTQVAERDEWIRRLDAERTQLEETIRDLRRDLEQLREELTAEDLEKPRSGS